MRLFYIKKRNVIESKNRNERNEIAFAKLISNRDLFTSDIHTA